MKTQHLDDATLNALIDGDLDDLAQAGAEAHLSGCPACMAELAALRALLQGVGALPRGIAPARDLLPGIHAAIDASSAVPAEATPIGEVGARRFGDRPLRSVRWLLAAAAIVLVALSSAVTALLVGGEQPAFIAVDAAVGVPASELRRLETRLIAATDELEGVLRAERSQLAPETFRILEENLAIVDSALAEARAALRADPGNPALSEMLIATYERKLDLLRSAAASVAS